MALSTSHDWLSIKEDEFMAVNTLIVGVVLQRLWIV